MLFYSNQITDTVQTSLNQQEHKEIYNGAVSPINENPQGINEWEVALPMDVYLVSNYPGIRKLGDYLFQEIVDSSEVKFKSGLKRHKAKESLKIILINLLIGYMAGLPVRYSRTKSAYTGNGRYKQLFFGYNRVLLIIKMLINFEYIIHKIGIKNPKTEVTRQSRMKATAKLISLFIEYDLIRADIQPLPPIHEDLVQLREPDAMLTDEAYKKLEPMRARLNKYNKSINSSKIEFKLSRDTKINRNTLKNIKYRALKGKYEITEFHTTDNDTTVDIYTQIIQGYKIGSKNYIAINKQQLSEETISIINKQLDKVEFDTINNIYVEYNNYYNTNTNKEDNYSYKDRSCISMTGTFSGIDEDNQSVDTSETTTIEEFNDNKEKRPLADFGIKQLNFISKYQYLHRVFNNLPDLGGRFYGATYITMPKEVRRCVYINDSPAVELDFGAHHIRMLYHYYLNMPYEEDPYKELCKNNPDERDIYKRVLLVAINAKSEDNSIKGIRKKLHDDGIVYDLTNKAIKKCLEKVKRHHPRIARFINSGIGLELQYYEGCIVDIVLSRMTKQGIPCLQIHDSFIVPTEHEDTLHEFMVEAYKKVIGNFMPVIEKK